MEYWLATAADQQARTWLTRFDPVYWTVDFPRPMMAAVTTTGPHALRLDLAFYRKNDLAGLIWWAEDRVDHPLLAYETSRDFRRCVLSFRWRSAGVKPLDAVNGPTLTIEGRDAGGTGRSWYVRLWNYAVGDPEDAVVRLDFGALDGGFLLPGEADPVWAGDVDRMFVSMVPGGYDGADADLAAPVEAWVTLDEMDCTGSGSVLALGDVLVPPHGLSIATGYDDAYNVTPARLARTIERLGYRGSVNHYVGMSHYFRLSGGYVSLAGGALNVACAAWHRDWAARLAGAGLGLIVSLSYELFDAHCWNDWKQRDVTGAPAQTGYTPPSTLLSPAHAGAMAYLAAVARAFVQISVAAGQAPRLQIGEPWWWVNPGGQICLYDDAARAAFSPPDIADVRATLTPAQVATLDAAGALLAASTATLFAAVRADHATCQRLLLVYLPGATGNLARANMPTGWARPAVDVLQLEDYEWVTAGNASARAAARVLVADRLVYPAAERHEFAGFVADAAHREQWARIVEAARASDAAATFVWALPQVMRDGFTIFAIGEDDMAPFADVSFPLALGRDARVEPAFSTAIVTTASGHEQRNADWTSARMRYDAGPGVRSEADLATLIAFFRARRGAAQAFRFRDPLDHSSGGAVPGAGDQRIGIGDGLTTRFALVKHYGDEMRSITRPVPTSVRVSVAGVERASGWTLADAGAIDFAVAPVAGAEVRAGFLFDVPVRFAEDRLNVSAGMWAAGEVASVGLVEVREG